MQDDVSELGRDVIKAVSRLLQSSAATTDATHLEYTPDILAAEVLTAHLLRLLQLSLAVLHICSA
jgi:hypothetical protein